MTTENPAVSKRCPVCGADVQTNAFYCWMCGRPLQGQVHTPRRERKGGGVGTTVGGCLAGVVLTIVSIWVFFVVICATMRWMP